MYKAFTYIEIFKLYYLFLLIATFIIRKEFLILDKTIYEEPYATMGIIIRLRRLYKGIRRINSIDLCVEICLRGNRSCVKIGLA